MYNIVGKVERYMNPETENQTDHDMNKSTEMTKAGVDDVIIR